MDFALSEIHEMIRETAHRFANQELLPVAAKIDKSGEFPADKVRKLAELGFLGMAVDEAYAALASTTSPTPWRWKRSAVAAPAPA